jgi:hypothetical protein
MGLSPSPQVSVCAFELRVRPNTVKRVRPRQKTRPNIVRDSAVERLTCHVTANLHIQPEACPIVDTSLSMPQSSHFQSLL